MRRLALTTITLGLIAANASSALSEPIDVKGRYFEFATVFCPASATCSLIDRFAAVPAGNQLIITQTSCVITSKGTAKLAQAFVAAKLVSAGAPVRIHYVVPELVLPRSYAFNQQVLIPLRARETPFILATFSETTDIAMACSISGELLP